MNKLIKFRVWDNNKKSFLKDDDQGFIILDMNGTVFQAYLDYNKYGLIELKDVVVQQFTGYLDKNGEEIYYGDIIKSLGCGGPATFGGFTMPYHEYDLIEEWRDYCIGREPYEIIGNVLENPELLNI